MSSIKIKVRRRPLKYEYGIRVFYFTISELIAWIGALAILTVFFVFLNKSGYTKKAEEQNTVEEVWSKDPD